MPDEHTCTAAPGAGGPAISTQEREDAIAVLGDHLAAGRLFIAEYEQRVTAGIDAQTHAEVRLLFDDLPLPHPAFMRPPTPPVPAHVAPVRYPRKSRIAAGLLQIMFPFGTGRFYTGHTRIAVAQLLLVFVGVGVIWSLIDGALLLAVGGTDAHDQPLVI